MAARTYLAALAAALLLSACGFSRESRPAAGEEANASQAPADGSGPMSVDAQGGDAGGEAMMAEAAVPPAEQGGGQPTPSAERDQAFGPHLQPVDDREARLAAAMRRDFEKYDVNRSGGLDTAEFARLEADVLQTTAPTEASDPPSRDMPLRREVVTTVAPPDAARYRQPMEADTGDRQSTEAAEDKRQPARPQSRPRPEYARPVE